MSFDTLKKDDLLKIANDYGVDVKPTDTRAVIIAALAEDGVNWDDVVKMDQTISDISDSVVKKDDAEKLPEAKQLLRMLRENGTYEIRGYKFTKGHPFALVGEDDAEFIVENDPSGFRYATPKEAKDFYQ